MNYSLLTDDLLLKLLKADDEWAFKEIYLRHWKSLFSAAYYRLNNKETATDLVQNLFLFIWEKRATLSIENLPQYLQTAIKNRVINFIATAFVQKKYQQYAAKNFGKNNLVTQDSIQYNELYTAFQMALSQMPEKTSTIFKLSRFEKLSIKQIALQLNLSEKAVEYHISNALKNLRISLKEYIVCSVFILFFNLS